MLVATGIQKSFFRQGQHVSVLRGADLRVDAGQIAVIRGPSGCGKTTLLLTLGAMMRPDLGTVSFESQDVYALPGRRRDALRRSRLGFIFQTFHLIPYLTVLENVAVAALPSRPQDQPQRILSQLGLEPRLQHRPHALSAGELQRVAIARALANEPAVILADEPTGNLDEENSANVFRQLGAFRDQGGSVVVVTHDPVPDTRADHVYHFRDGKLVTEQ